MCERALENARWRYSSDRQVMVRNSIPDRDFKIKIGCKKHLSCRSCIKYGECSVTHRGVTMFKKRGDKDERMA